MLARVDKRPTSQSLVLLKASLVSVWSLHGHRDAHSQAVPRDGAKRQEPSLCWGTAAWEGEQQSVNELWQQLTKSVGFFLEKPKHAALNIRHAAHTKGRLPDLARTDGWRTQGREPRAVTGAAAMIRLSYFAEIGLAMLMLLVPFQQGYAGASGGCDSAQAELQQRPQPCTTAFVPPATVPGMLRPGQALGAGRSLGPAARAGKGGAMARKTSMHQRVVSAPWELGFCK